MPEFRGSTSPQNMQSPQLNQQRQAAAAQTQQPQVQQPAAPAPAGPITGLNQNPVPAVPRPQPMQGQVPQQPIAPPPVPGTPPAPQQQPQPPMAADGRPMQPEQPKKKRSRKKMLLGVFFIVLAVLLAAGGGFAAYAFWYLPNLPQNVVARSVITAFEGYPLQSRTTTAEVQLKFENVDEPITLTATIELEENGSMAVNLGLKDIQPYINAAVPAEQLAAINNLDIGDLSATMVLGQDGQNYMRMSGLETLSDLANGNQEFIALAVEELVLIELGAQNSQVPEDQQLTFEQQQAAATQASTAVAGTVVDMVDDMVNTMNDTWLSIDSSSASTVKELTCGVQALLNEENYSASSTVTDALTDAYLDNQFVSAEDMGQENVSGVSATKYDVQLMKTELLNFLQQVSEIDFEADGTGLEALNAKLDACSSSGVDQPVNSQFGTGASGPATSTGDTIKDIIKDLEDVNESAMDFVLWIDGEKRIVQFDIELRESDFENTSSSTVVQDDVPLETYRVIASMDYQNSRGTVAEAQGSDAESLESALDGVFTRFEENVKTTLGLSDEDQLFTSPRGFTDPIFDA